MSVYGRGRTAIQLPGEVVDVVMVRGVQQGDPLSPTLFNVVTDQVMKDLNCTVGFDLGSRPTCRAFVDDVVLLVSSKDGLQQNVDIACKRLALFGLEISADESCTLGIAPVAHQVLDDNEIYVKNLHLEGCNLSTPQFLGRISKAPLKPYQRMEVLRVHYLPSLIHQLSFCHLTKDYLRAVDLLVRDSVSGWLWLPKNCTYAFIHLAMRESGLGVCTNQHGSLWRCLYLGGVDWAEQATIDNGTMVETSTKVKAYWREKLIRSVDGVDLVGSAKCPPSTDWI
ncbi:hypothetical protein PR048_032221 [Dryococelus australis]|uniref:Reverse transcriptase domain-containing protein n=1 Tax=Dryococelus australis TaxID=614101 RepID=A0ABQ9G1L2_9NEOP|nr:hypothetical protein PR048_032221 [Dryococelus australis]